MKKYIDNKKKVEKAILVAVITQHQNKKKTQEYIEELTFLANTLGIQTIDTFIQKLDNINSNTYIGTGKLEEIRQNVVNKKIDMVIFDDDLSPSQVRNIENILQCKIIDRSLLILDIFSMRAKTKKAAIQVALAQYQYLLPRLTRLWTHLSKQKGGIGMRGPGEKELETDRRLVKKKISLLQNKLTQVERQSAVQRKLRDKFVRVTLVGYTNVGKSSIMQLLSKKHIESEDKLFATVESKVRKVVLNNIPFLLSDTVGFIRKLPHTLLASFRSTLEEVREADLLLHVVDLSHSLFQEQIEIVQKILTEIDANHIPTILVFNKIDKIASEQTINLDAIPPAEVLKKWEKIYPNTQEQPTIFISAYRKNNITTLKKLLYQHIIKKHQLIYPNYCQKNIVQ